MFDVLMIDPPWPQKKGGLRKLRPNQGRELSYATMPWGDIFSLLDAEIFPQATTTHCVFMWTIDNFLSECEAEMSERGYRRHCRMIWDKTNGIAPAFTLRFSHEYLIWYYKPKLLPIATEQRGKFRTVFQEKARQHSRKPELSYKIIEALYPDANRYDVFSRQKRDGWEQYGNELTKFNF